MAFWLLKTEPTEWSWDHQHENGGVSQWDGVRNALAQKNMKAMKLNDRCLFYHSVKEKSVVGVVEVIKEWYPEDPKTSEGGKWGQVDVKECFKLPTPVTLAEIKAEVNKKIDDFALLKQQRLSVAPVSEKNFQTICEMGGHVFSSETTRDKENADSDIPTVAEPVTTNLEESKADSAPVIPEAAIAPPPQLRRSSRKRKSKGD